MTRLTMQHLLERAELANVQVAPQDRANILQGQRVQRRRHLRLGRILTRMTTRVGRSMEARSAQQKPYAAKFVSTHLCGLECFDNTACAFGARLLKTRPNRFEGVHLGAKIVRYGWWGVASSSCFANLEEQTEWARVLFLTTRRRGFGMEELPSFASSGSMVSRTALDSTLRCTKSCRLKKARQKKGG